MSQIFIVDDDEAIRDALGWLFRSRGHAVRTWPSAEALIASSEIAHCGCLLLDIRMDGMSGLELFGWLHEHGHDMPVIFLTGHGDVPMAVGAIKQGAFDFVEKPFNDNELVDRALAALAMHQQQLSKRAAAQAIDERVAQLTQREIEVMERVLAGHEVVAHMKVSKKPAVGTVLQMTGDYTAQLLGRWPDDQGQLFRLRFSAEPHGVMEQHGHVPLPPYIDHGDTAEDVARYQTVFAAKPGAAAAPTAALHFDEGVLAALDARGVRRANVTLHVGAGTFSPVKTDNLAEHRMHREWYDVPAATQQAIAETKARGGRIVTVGTTTIRTLESWARTGQASGDTEIFITPGFDFKVADLLVTNFHLPKSTLMMLVSAFAGYEHIMALYRHAIAQRYRFFSYGDAMVLERVS